VTFVKHDEGKLMVHLIPPEFLEGLAAILTLGAVKYSPRNWVNCPEPFERYYSALQRHLLAFAKGERTDAESGKSHLYHAAACLVFLEHFERVGALDDKPQDDIEWRETGYRPHMPAVGLRPAEHP
jgi:hypothetical protein